MSDGAPQPGAAEPEDEDQRRLHILEMIDRGLISPAEGLRMLSALEAEEPAPALPAQGSIPSNGAASQAEAARVFDPGETRSRPVPPNFEKWRRWWMIPLWAGVGVTVLGGLLMFWALQRSGLGFWFFCAGVPFVLGLAAMVLAWQTRTAHWLHLRIQQKPGEWPQTIAFSFPLPLRLASWFFRRFGGRFQGMGAVNVDELIRSLDRTATPETPFYLNVDDEDGEKVEIFIG